MSTKLEKLSAVQRAHKTYIKARGAYIRAMVEAGHSRITLYNQIYTDPDEVDDIVSALMRGSPDEMRPKMPQLNR